MNSSGTSPATTTLRTPEPAAATSADVVPWFLHRVSRRYRAAVLAGLRAATLGSLPQSGAWVLVALASGRHDASELVEAIGVAKQAVSKAVDELVAEGLVQRSPNPADRRRTDLSLTGKGRRAVETLRAAVQAAERSFVAQVGEAAWTTTVETLGVLAGMQGADMEGAGMEGEKRAP